MSDFYKFPSTPHIAALDNNVRDDKVFTLNERTDFLSHYLFVEEKVDGGNLGISFDESGQIRLQNRGNTLREPYLEQWKKIPDWLRLKIDALFDSLAGKYILFGEWCYARHTVYYTHLPDWFIGFDVFDIHKHKFLSVGKRNEIFKQIGIVPVHKVSEGH
ncbi:MAG: RNA ligase family protein, partial [Deferribacteraceae bacterium]|nr:RNA ligase family protein [Deferribacteraceae bacterium]